MFSNTSFLLSLICSDAFTSHRGSLFIKIVVIRTVPDVIRTSSEFTLPESSEEGEEFKRPIAWRFEVTSMSTLSSFPRSCCPPLPIKCSSYWLFSQLEINFSQHIALQKGEDFPMPYTSYAITTRTQHPYCLSLSTGSDVF